MTPACVRCDAGAIVTVPFALCRSHAIAFFAGLVAVGAATARVRREAPGNVDGYDLRVRFTDRSCGRCGAAFRPGAHLRTVCFPCRSRLAKHARACRVHWPRPLVH